MVQIPMNGGPGVGRLPFDPSGDGIGSYGVTVGAMSDAVHWMSQDPACERGGWFVKKRLASPGGRGLVESSRGICVFVPVDNVVGGFRFDRRSLDASGASVDGPVEYGSRMAASFAYDPDMRVMERLAMDSSLVLLGGIHSHPSGRGPSAADVSMFPTFYTTPVALGAGDALELLHTQSNAASRTPGGESLPVVPPVGSGICWVWGGDGKSGDERRDASVSLLWPYTCYGALRKRVLLKGEGASASQENDSAAPLSSPSRLEDGVQ